MRPLLYSLQFRFVCVCVCLTDITAKEFIELRGKQRSRYELLVDFLSEMLSVPPDDVNIFSLMDVKERMLDVRFAVHGGSSFLQPEKMHGYLAAHKQKVCCCLDFTTLLCLNAQHFTVQNMNENHTLLYNIMSQSTK